MNKTIVNKSFNHLTKIQKRIFGKITCFLLLLIFFAMEAHIHSNRFYYIIGFILQKYDAHNHIKKSA